LAVVAGAWVVAGACVVALLGACVVGEFDDTLVPPDEWQADRPATAASTSPTSTIILPGRFALMDIPLSIAWASCASGYLRSVAADGFPDDTRP